MHLQPLDFSLALRSSSSSARLALVQFHVKATRDIENTATIIWQQQHAEVRGEKGNRSESTPEFDYSTHLASVSRSTTSPSST